MALKTWVARFVVDNGKVTEEGGRLRTFQRRRLDEPDVDLHLLCEPEGLKGEDLGAQSLDAIGRLFLQERLSLTGGLLRSLRGTHQTLLDWNRRSVPKEQVSVGIAAAVVGGNLVYFAQAGPGVAFLKQKGVVRRLVAEDEALSPLGEGELQPALRRIEMESGDVLIAASLAIESFLDVERLTSMLERGSEEALPELYLLTRDLPNFALFAISCSDTPDDDPGTSEDESEPEPFAAFTDRGTGDQPDALAPPDRPSLAELLPPLPEEKSLELAASTLPVTNMPPPLDISKPVVRLRSDQSIGRGEYTRTTGSRPRLSLDFTNGKALRIGGAIALAMLVVAFVPGLITEGRSEKLSDLTAGAQVQLANALITAEPQQRRTLLEDTRRMANEALRIDPANALAADIRQQATTNIAALDAVFDLGPMTTVAQLSRQVTGDISLEALAIAAGNAYLLDTKGGRILAVPLTGGGPPTTVYQDGETYGGTPAKKPIYFTWEGNERTGRMLILDTERKLFEMRPGTTPAPLALRRTSAWSSVAGIATYDGNLYVLDPRGNQVHKYLPAAAGFDSEPTFALTGQQGFGDAQGLVVDGDIYVYFKDGKVRRFRGGADTGFSFGGIDKLPKAASDMALVTQAEELYLADTSNKRVVITGKDGTYRRQLVSNGLTDIRAIALDPTGGSLYVIVGDQLLSGVVVR